mmetsp:Transcript_32273/g.68694  ORF Transcript_32273/g.68694 Transcript_32273/m.68694 type:complete len:299 (-) Transcript_32273:80-976(-)
MSWYVGLDGRQIWVDRDEVAFTVTEIPKGTELATESLTYLATSFKQAVYQEHMIDEEEGTGRNKKRAGKQRGYVVRVGGAEGERTRVHPPFQKAADWLLDKGVVTRIDLDESAKEKVKKKRGKAKEEEKAQEKEEEEKEVVVAMPLGENECRLDTIKRIRHNAHGQGFRLQISEDGTVQRIHCFTAKQDVALADWHKLLVSALEATGSRVMLGRMAVSEAGGGEQARGAGNAPKDAQKDRAKDDEDEWLQSMLGRCMVSKEDERKKQAPVQADDAPAGEGSEPPPEPKKKVLPPWLRR